MNYLRALCVIVLSAFVFAGCGMFTPKADEMPPSEVEMQEETGKATTIEEEEQKEPIIEETDIIEDESSESTLDDE